MFKAYNGAYVKLCIVLILILHKVKLNYDQLFILLLFTHSSRLIELMELFSRTFFFSHFVYHNTIDVH